MSNHWKIVIVATVFNLFFEYSLRGFITLVEQPLLIIFLVMVYFSLFTMLEALISRFKLDDVGLGAAIFIYSSIMGILFLPARHLYTSPMIFGINWGVFFWLFVSWWICLQTIMAFYIGRRFFPRNDDEPFFTRGRFLIALGFYLFGGLAFKIGANPPTPSTMGIISSLITVVLALAYLLRRVSRGLNKQVANSSLLMDVLSITTVIVFISLALSIQSVVLYDYHSISGFALDVIVKFTATTAVIMLIYRFVFKRRIAV